MARSEDQRGAPWRSLAKVHAPDASREVSNAGILLHRAIGSTWEVDLHLEMHRGG